MQRPASVLVPAADPTAGTSTAATHGARHARPGGGTLRPMRLCVLVPVYNEKPTLRAMLDRLWATPLPMVPPLSARRPGLEPATSPATEPSSESGVEPADSPSGRSAPHLSHADLPSLEAPVERRVFLADDASTDGSTPIIRELASAGAVSAVFHERNAGKGAALRSALRAALEEGGDIFLIHDADLEYDPADHAAALAPIFDGRADAVIGTRFLGRTHRVLYYWHRLANGAITQLSNMLTNLNLSDIECCTKAFTRPVAQRLVIREDRFGVEPELVSRLAHMRLPQLGAGRPRRLRIYEVPVSYAGRTYDEGKKITWRDGVRAVYCILKYNITNA